MLISSTSNGLDSIVQLLTVLLIFIFVLVLTYYVTKFTAGLQNGKLSSAGVEILMTFKIAPNKYIQDTVTLLGELTKDDISEFGKADTGTAMNISFKDIFDKLKK